MTVQNETRFGDLEDQPPEPDFSLLRALDHVLATTEDWITGNDDSDEVPNLPLLAETVSLLREILMDYDDEDDRIRAFVYRVERAAFWARTDDEELNNRLGRLVEGDHVLPSPARVALTQ